MQIQVGRRYASTPSNIKTALQKSGKGLEKRMVAGRLKFRFAIHQIGSETSSEEESIDATLLNICDRFHRSISHLRQRRKGKNRILFSDEYDVQDVFGTVLKCCYEDVRDEEWCPSYAGNAARIDFIIVDCHTATELKRARDRQAIANELTLDIAHYSRHPEVKKLVCFVYDPEGHLSRDAIQIERDLSGTHKHENRSLRVVVLIRPK